MIRFFKSLFSKKPVEPQAPYKVESPETIIAVGEPPATVVIAEGAGIVEATAPAKKPRKPRAPKAEVVAEKPAKAKAPRKPKAEK